MIDALIFFGASLGIAVVGCFACIVKLKSDLNKLENKLISTDSCLSTYQSNFWLLKDDIWALKNADEYLKEYIRQMDVNNYDRI